MPRKQSVYNLPTRDCGANSRAGFEQLLRKSDTEASSGQVGRATAKRLDSELSMHRRDGTISEQHSHANDPIRLRNKR